MESGIGKRICEFNRKKFTKIISFNINKSGQKSKIFDRFCYFAQMRFCYLLILKQVGERLRKSVSH